MSNKSRGIFVFLSLLLGLSSACSTQSANRKLDENLEHEPFIESSDDVRQKASDLIQSSDILTSDQKTKLLALQERTRSKTRNIQETCFKLRALLIKEIIRKNYDQNKVSLIKTRLKEMEHQKLTVLFKAIDDANSVLGRQTSNENEKLLRSFEHQAQSHLGG